MFDIEKWAANERIALEARIVKTRKEFKLREALHARVRTLGLSCKVDDLDNPYTAIHGMCLTIQREELPLLREVFGRLEISGKDIKDSKDATIYVHVELAEQPKCGISFRYVKTLSAEQKCQIKTITTSYEALVCEKGS